MPMGIQRPNSRTHSVAVRTSARKPDIWLAPYATSRWGLASCRLGGGDGQAAGFHRHLCFPAQASRDDDHRSQRLEGAAVTCDLDAGLAGVARDQGSDRVDRGAGDRYDQVWIGGGAARSSAITKDSVVRPTAATVAMMTKRFAALMARRPSGVGSIKGTTPMSVSRTMNK